MAHIKKTIKKNIKTPDISTEKNTSNVVVTLVICALMLLIAYGVSSLIYALNTDSVSVTDVKQYNINASATFDIQESEYYVMFYDKTGSDALSLGTLVSNYRNSNKNSIYVVDLSKEYNKSIVKDTSNPNAKNANELAISSSTLVKIKNGEINGYYENMLLIEKELK